MRRVLAVTFLFAGCLVLLPATKALAAAKAADFNGDGFGDLAIGVPTEHVGAVVSAGAVNVLYGGANGLTSAGDQFWTEDEPGVPDDAEAGDAFGAALANGDFNNDGYSDLAIGASGENVGGDAGAGAVVILYGSATGLSVDNAQFWSQDEAGVAGDGAELGDQFGASLAAADLNGDGSRDLAIGVPGENVGGVSNAGAVNVLYGSVVGLSSTNSQFWTQDSSGVAGTAQDGDAFGYSLAAANFGKSSHADLAIGVAGEDVGTIDAAGAVNVLYGSSTGLTATGSQQWTQNSSGVPSAAETGDFLGWSLAAANFGKSSQADLAIGVEGQDVGSIGSAGAVNVLYGSSTGLTGTGAQLWHQNSSGINGTAEPGDDFGFSLAAANLGNSSEADLAVGVPFESVGLVNAAGGVNVLYGSSTGLTSTGDQFWTQNSSGVDGTAEDGDVLGWAVSAADFGVSFSADLAVGAAFEDVGSANAAGAVNVLYGSSTGLTSTGDQLWNQDSSGLAGDGAEDGDAFGSTFPGTRTFFD